MLNVSWGSWARMLGESLGMLHMGFESLMRSLFSFMMSGTKRSDIKGIFDARANDCIEDRVSFVVAMQVIVVRPRFVF